MKSISKQNPVSRVFDLFLGSFTDRFRKSIHFRFIEKLKGDIPGKGVKEQLQILCSIYALYVLHKHMGDFLSTSTITPKQASLADDQLRSLYSQV